MNKKVKNIIKLTLCSIAIIAAITISINIKNGKILQTDLKIYDFFSKNIIYDKLTPVVKIITHIGSAKIVIILTILLCNRSSRIKCNIKTHNSKRSSKYTSINQRNRL